MSSDKDQETKGIKVSLIIEVLGKPKEHLTESLGKIIEQIDKEKGVTVEAKDVHDPKELENKKGFYTAFADVQIEVEEIIYLMILMFKYMPAHVEIVEPELIALTNHGWGDIINELTRRLHGYDEIARVLQLQNQQFRQKLDEIGIKVIDGKNKKEEPKPKKKNK